MPEDRRREMLALIRRAHAGQSRNQGRVPYWMHPQAAAQILDWAVEHGGEIDDPALREDLFLAAQGHDLYEDTAVTPDEVRAGFGARVDSWIRGMTNDGDDDRTAYLARLAAAPDEVRLIKLADLIDNTGSCAYGIPDLGVEWMERFYLPIATETRELLTSVPFARYPRTAALLLGLLEYTFARLVGNLEMWTMPDDANKGPGGESDKAKAEEKAAKRKRLEIDPVEWQKALERTRKREEEEGKKFPGGKPFPVPDTDDY